MHVEAVLKRKGRDVVTLHPSAGICSVAGLLAQDTCEIVVVCDREGKIVGVVTDSDVLRRVEESGPGANPCEAIVDDVMSRNVVSCRPDDSLERVLALMIERGLRRLPVTDEEGLLKGVITLHDVLAYLYEEAKLEERFLRNYFLGIGYQ